MYKLFSSGSGFQVGVEVTGQAGLKVLVGIIFFRAATNASRLGIGQVLINLD